MTVRIDEVVAEVGEEPPASRGTGTGGEGGTAGGSLDLDRLDYELGRRRHRLARLWAD